MILKNYDDMMQKEIQARMESSAWDFSIATAVMREKRKTLRHFTYAASSLAFAAVFTVVFIFGLGRDAEKPVYSDFISQQVEKTHAGSFEKNILLVSSTKAEQAVIFSDDMTSLIDDALIMR